MAQRSIWDLTPLHHEIEECQTNPVSTTSVLSSFIKLHSNVVKGCKACGLSKPNKLQLQVLSHFKELPYGNLLISAPPRSGKTSSAVIGILDNFSKSLSKYSLAIIVCPTYEVADISYCCCLTLAKFCDVSIYFTNKSVLPSKDGRNPKEIIIGTPDKILDLWRSSFIRLKKASYFVIDEADCLGNPKQYFMNISEIVQVLPSKCCSILSTVFKNKAIEDFVEKKMDEPTEISVADNFHRNALTRQLFLLCTDKEDKIESLVFVISLQLFPGKIVIFTETKDVAKNLALQMHHKNITAVLLIGELSILQRKRVLDDFKIGIVQVLITTRSFVSVIPAVRITKLIHFDQILDDKDRLDLNVYKRREFLLSTTESCLIAYFIESRWKEYLFEHKDVINEKSFFNQIEIVDSSKLRTYF